MAFSPEILVTIVLAVLGAFWVLIRIIRHMDSKRIEKLAEELSDAKKHYMSASRSFSDTDKRVEVMKNQISNLEKENVSIRAEIAELRKKHEANVDTLADIRETIAGFGAHYVTRREFMDKGD